MGRRIEQLDPDEGFRVFAHYAKASGDRRR
jgi:hypothetical protein